MASANNNNAYSSDYTHVAECLLAIHALQTGGSLNNQTELLRLLRLFEQDVLKKLYLITIRVLKVVTSPDGSIYIGGDFSEKNFSEKDFNVGALVINPPKYEDYFYGDFDGEDFLFDDFYIGYLDTSGTGYSSIFTSISNMLKEINNYGENTFSEEDRYALNQALEAFLEAFKEIKSLLAQSGLNPCGPADTYFNNTGGIYLQAAGSDGHNGIAEGIHLRWSLTGEIGDNHLPKGEYYNAHNNQLSGFNRKDDYVKVFRSPNINAPTIAIDLEFNRPLINFKTRQWIYTINNTINGKKITNRVKLKFDNANAYKQLARTIDPLLNYYQFLSSYNDIITLEIEDKTSYSIGFHLNNAGNEKAILKVKILSQIANDTDNSTDEVRKTMVLDSSGDSLEFIKADNIAKISIKKSPNAIIKNFYFSTYHDFLTTRQTTDWTEVGNGFGISLDNTVVFDRLENENYSIDHLWPHYNDGTTVKVANYQDKWLTSRTNSPSVKEVLHKYLQLSDTNPRAEEFVSNVNQEQQHEGFMISYLDIVNMQALDYHFARMLGLGHIDTIDGDAEYFYQVRYTNKSSLNSSDTSDFVYTSLPVTKTNYLLPEKPKMRPVAYQFLGDNDSMNDMLNDGGYTKFDNARVVNIGRMPFADELVGHDFFEDLNAIENQNIFEKPKPVFYGLEYRAENHSSYVKPEITSGSFQNEHQYYAYDGESANPPGVLEPEPLKDDVLSLFIHFEKQSGIHFYAIYGINWFSRVSERSDEVSTDPTGFPLLNTLLPPSDVTVQYIQEEDPLLFTTTAEQNWLAGRKQTFGRQDIGFTRVTFNWLEILDVTNLIDQSAAQLNKLIKADHVKAYFKPKLFLTVAGQINDILPVRNNDKFVKLVIGSYKQIDGTEIVPIIAPEDFPRFHNSMLTTPGGKFRVETFAVNGSDFQIVVEVNAERKVVDGENNSGSYSTQNFTIFPEIGSRFTLIENLSLSGNWEQVVETVELKSFADVNNPHIERITDSEGKETIYWVGGLHNQATVTPLFGAEYPDGLLGYYKIKFDSSGNLNEHPQINLPFNASDPNKNSPDQLRQAHVEWYKGLIRIPTVSGEAEPKLLEVIRIEETHPVELYVYDPGYADDAIKVSVPAALTVPVNFHPGYRVYFFPEPDHTFNGTNILPVGNDNDKRTLLGLQTIDSRPESDESASEVSVPAILLARKIEEPIQFEAPITFGLKVRPDATGKASFTFDVKIEPTVNGIKRNPFGFMFYRTTNEDVLEALYKPSTVIQILTALADLEEDLFYSQRYLELVNLTFDQTNTDSFKVFPAIPNPYGFPKPDKLGLIEPSDSLEIKKLKYFAAIQETLLPLTEQNPILDFIKQGLQTENALPVIRDLDGNLLDATDTAFNPFPMIRQYNKPSQPNTTYIRFTDYFLSGASRKLYFFAGVEVTNQLEPGLLSPFAGPVTILQTLPSAPPLVTRFAINLDSFSAESGASVVFNIAPISPEDRISKIRIYRSKDKDRTVTLKGMEYYIDRDILAEDSEGYEITDDFSDLTAAPLGDTIYYRLAGIRTINNEKEKQEEVLSLGTEVIAINLPDYLNPEAPELTYSQAGNKLTWTATANKAHYHVYKQNNRGNWEKVYTVDASNSSTPLEYVLPAPLLPVDEDGDKLYYRFKVQVQNTSGLLNLTEKELTVPTIL